MEAIKVAAAGFVIPFMAVYTPALMLQDGGPLADQIGYIPAGDLHRRKRWCWRSGCGALR